jgi:hypothetical protein
MDPNPGIEQRVAETEQAAAAMRSEAARQLESARDLAKRVRAEALHELEDARARVARIAAREEEMAERWAQLLEAENALAVSQGSTRKSDDLTGIPSQLIADATAEAQQIITRSHEEARNIREEAMRLLAVAEGEKAESREIAMTETQRAAMEAERLRAEAAEEAKRLREEASRLAAAGADSAYVKRAGRKLPRIGDSANSLLSEMSGLRAKMNEDQDSKVG